MPVQREIKSPRIQIEYNTEINGTPEPKELAHVTAVVANLTGRSMEERGDYTDREIVTLDGTNTSDVMRGMDIKIKATVANKTDPNGPETLDIEIPIDSMDAFSPERVANHIPQVRALLQLKRLLIEGSTAVKNIPALTKMIEQIYGDKEAYAALRKQLAPLETLKLGLETKESE